jgi:hypothetical protein
LLLDHIEEKLFVLLIPILEFEHFCHWSALLPDATKLNAKQASIRFALLPEAKQLPDAPKASI